MQGSCPIRLIFLDLIILIYFIFGKGYKLGISLRKFYILLRDNLYHHHHRRRHHYHHNNNNNNNVTIATNDRQNSRQSGAGFRSSGYFNGLLVAEKGKSHSYALRSP